MSGSRTSYPGSESAGQTLTAANFDKLPGGVVGYASHATATQTIATATWTDLAGDGTGSALAIDVAETAGRFLVVMWHVTVSMSAVTTGDDFGVRATMAGTVVGSSYCSPGSALCKQTLSGVSLVVASGSSDTFKIQGSRVSGTATWTIDGSSTERSRIVVWAVSPSF